MKQYYVYILSSNTGTLYTGVTDNLERRLYEHRNNLVEGFTSKYNIKNLLFYEKFNNINQAIEAEKRIKGWTRIKKINLIKTLNPSMKNLL